MPRKKRKPPTYRFAVYQARDGHAWLAGYFEGTVVRRGFAVKAYEGKIRVWHWDGVLFALPGLAYFDDGRRVGEIEAVLPLEGDLRYVAQEYAGGWSKWAFEFSLGGDPYHVVFGYSDYADMPDYTELFVPVEEIPEEVLEAPF